MSISGITFTVTVTDVRSIFSTGLEDPSIEAALRTAAILVRDQIGTGITDTITKNEIIKYLAAHFCSVQSPRVASRGHGRTNESYQGQTTNNLSSSLFGQTAMLLDSTGTLAQWSNAGGAGQVIFRYIGNDTSGDPAV